MHELSYTRSWLQFVADPTRIQVVEVLSKLEVATIAQLAGAVNSSSQTVRRHLDALLATGVVAARPGVSDGETPGRPAHRYELNPSLGADVRGFFQAPAASRTGAADRPARLAWVQQLLDEPGVGVWILDSDGRTLFVNQTAADLAGRKASTLVGAPIGEVIDIFASWPARTRGLSGSHYRLQRPDGFAVWAEVRAQSTPEGAGPADGAMLTLTDVTLHRRRQLAAARLAKSDEVLRRFLQLVSDRSDPTQSLQRGVSFLATELDLPLLATGLGARDERSVRTITGGGHFYEANASQLARDLAVPREGATMTALRSGKAVVVDDYSRANSSGPVIDTTAAMSSASIPVTDRVWLTAFADVPGTLDEHVVSVLESAARIFPATLTS